MEVLLRKTTTKCQARSRMGGEDWSNGPYLHTVLIVFSQLGVTGLTLAWPRTVTISCHKLDDFWTRWDKHGNSGPPNTHAKVGLIIINLYSLTIILMSFSRITVQWWRNCYLFNHFQIPAVRDFIHGALLEFERADFRKVPGKAPTAYFYVQYGNILE